MKKNQPLKTTFMHDNNLFPIFLKLDQKNVLLIGGGNVALEKYQTITKNSPNAIVKIIAKTISDPMKNVLQPSQATWEEREFREADLDNQQIVIIAINDKASSKEIKQLASVRGLMVNVADTPELCDFYLSSTVQKGNVKISISTNGKSPAISKKLREFLTDVIPNEISTSVENLNGLREKLKGDFQNKVQVMNAVSGLLLKNPSDKYFVSRTDWRKIAFFSFLGLLVFAFYEVTKNLNVLNYSSVFSSFDVYFFVAILGGFLAQLVDGMLGLGYGLTSSTFLMTFGFTPSVISSTVHSSEIFNSGTSAYHHYKNRNVNKKLFFAIVIFGVVGAAAGSLLLVAVENKYNHIIKPLIAFYTIIMGIRILSKAFNHSRTFIMSSKLKVLAGVGGFVDAFAGGGWGPIVTGTLIASGKHPRFVIGTVNAVEFFVTLSSVIVFFFAIEFNHWQIILGIVIGGQISAPIAAKLTGKISQKTLFILTGSMLILWSIILMSKYLFS